MRLASFTHNNVTRIGVVVDDSIVDLGAVPELPRDMVAFLTAGKDALDRARSRGPRQGAIASAQRGETRSAGRAGRRSSSRSDSTTPTTSPNRG